MFSFVVANDVPGDDTLSDIVSRLYASTSKRSAHVFSFWVLTILFSLSLWIHSLSCFVCCYIVLTRMFEQTEKLLECFARISLMLRKKFLLRVGSHMSAHHAFSCNLKWLDDFMTWDCVSLALNVCCRASDSKKHRQKQHPFLWWSILTRISHLMANLCAVDAMCMFSVCDAFSLHQRATTMNANGHRFLVFFIALFFIFEFFLLILR